MSLDLHCNGKSSFHSLLMPPWIRRCQNIFNLPDFNNDLLGTAHSVHSVKPVLSPVQPVKPVQPVHSVQPLQPVQSVHSVQQVHPYKPVKPIHLVHSVQPVLPIILLAATAVVEGGFFATTLLHTSRRTHTCSDDKLKVPKSIINWRRGSKKLLCSTKLWNWVSSWCEIVSNAYMTIFPWKYFYCSCDLANQTAALDRCRTTQIPSQWGKYWGS